MSGGIKKAMVLAAGYGLRARPLSLVRPKPLFPVLNKPLIAHALARLSAVGIEEAVVNAHHLADRLLCDLTGMAGGPTLFTLREEIILGTGGGIKNAEPFLGSEPFLVVNSDIYTNLDLGRAIQDHLRRRPLATLVLHDHPKYNMVGVNGDGGILGFREKAAEGRTRLAFTGVHLIEPEMFRYIPEGPGDIIEVYQALIDRGAPVRAHVVRGHDWWDAGSLEAYLELHGALLARRMEGPVLVDDQTRVHPEASIEGWACLALSAKVEAGARIKNTVLWPGSRVAAGVRLESCVVADGAAATEDASGMAIV